MIAASGGSISGTPTDDDMMTGSCTLAVSVSDGTNFAPEQSFTLTLNNMQPTLIVPNPITLTEDSLLAVVASATEIESNEEGSGFYSLGTAATTDCSPNFDSISIDSVNGELSMDPKLNFSGSCNIKIVFNDQNPSNSTTTQTVVVNVTNVNDAPTTNNRTYNISEDTPFFATGSNSLLAGAVDPDSTLQAIQTSSPANGSITFFDPVTGEFTYSPNAGFNGTDSFTYQVQETTPPNLSSTTKTMNIAAVNDTPVFTGAAPWSCPTSIAEDTLISCSAPATDEEGATLTWEKDAASTCGFISVTTSNGNISGTPTDDQVGSCSVVLNVSDGNSTTTDAFTLTVTNVVPSLTVNAPANVSEDDPKITILGDTDVQSSDEGFGAYSLISPAGSPACSSVSSNLMIDFASGLVEYQPSANFNGSCFIKIQFDDGNSPTNIVTQEVSVSVTAVNDAPSALADTYNVAKDDFLFIDAAAGVLGNDSDIEDPVASLIVTLTVSPTYHDGTFLLNSDGSFTYTPILGYIGSDSFTYELSDSNGGTSSATVTINVTGTDDHPEWTNPIYSDELITGSSFSVTHTATDPNSTPVNYSIIYGDMDCDERKANVTVDAAGVVTGTGFSFGFGKPSECTVKVAAESGGVFIYKKFRVVTLASSMVTACNLGTVNDACTISFATINLNPDESVHGNGSITLDNSDIIGPPDKWIYIKVGGDLNLQNSSTIQGNVVVVAANINIDATSQFIGDGLGYPADTLVNKPGIGPGGGSNGTYPLDTTYRFAGSGGGHGGFGGDSTFFWTPTPAIHEANPGGSFYGDEFRPREFGSSGGGGSGSLGGAGGGAVALFAPNGTIQLDGEIRVNGYPGDDRTATASQNPGGGGAAGSIFIAGMSVHGAGNLYAEGGAGGDGNLSGNGYNGGGGSGGRIAIYYFSGSPAFNPFIAGGPMGIGGSADKTFYSTDGDPGTYHLMQYPFP